MIGLKEYINEALSSDNKIYNGYEICGSVVRESDKAVLIKMEFFCKFDDGELKTTDIWFPKKCINKLSDNTFEVWRKGVDDWFKKFTSNMYVWKPEFERDNVEYFKKCKAEADKKKSDTKSFNERMGELILPYFYGTIKAYQDIASMIAEFAIKEHPETSDELNKSLDAFNEIKLPKGTKACWYRGVPSNITKNNISDYLEDLTGSAVGYACVPKDIRDVLVENNIIDKHNDGVVYAYDFINAYFKSINKRIPQAISRHWFKRDDILNIDRIGLYKITKYYL